MDSPALPAWTKWRKPGVPFLLGALMTLLTILRFPGSLLTPQFYAEDGALFFAAARNEGFLQTFFQPTAGYLNALPRLLAGLALLVPLERAPLALAVGALTVQMLPVFYLLSRRADSFLPTAFARSLAALLYAAMPNAREVYVTGTNSQWHLAPAILVMLLSAPPVGRAARFLDFTLLLVFAFTGPLGLLLLPLLPWYLRRSATRGRGAWGRVVGAVLFCGAAVQAVCLVSGTRLAGGPAASLGTVTAGQVAGIVSTHAFYDVILGEQRLTRLHFSAGLPLHLLGLAVLLVLGWAVVRLRQIPLIALGYLAAATVGVSLLFPTNELANWLKPHYGQRYYFFSTLFVVYATAHLAGQRGVWRGFGLALAAPLALLGFTSDFFRLPWTDTRYADQAAVFRALPAGEGYFIPTVPDGWGMRLLREAGARRGESPLTRFRAIPRETVVTLDPVRTDPARGMVTIRGSALDIVAGKPAGGVHLIVDGREYPASYGQVRSFPWSAAPDPADRRFERRIPIADLGSGPHRMTVAVLTHDRTGYYGLGRTTVFTVPGP